MFDPFNINKSFVPNNPVSINIPQYSSAQGPAIPAPQVSTGNSGTQTSTPAYSITAPQPLSLGNLLGVKTANAQTISQPPVAISSPAGPGSASAASAQQASDLQQYFPNLATSMQPRPFSINPGPTINSSSANSTYTSQDALNAAANARNALFNGSAPAGQIPSDSLYSSVVNGIFNASQYTPQEQSALQSYNSTQDQILQTQLAQRRQVQQLQEDGSITKEQAQGFITEANRRSNQDLANLSTIQSGNTLSLQTLGMLRQNQLGAYQNISSLIKPEQVAPGSTLVNPVTGQSTYQGMGASPQVIAQQASTFISQDEATGNLQLNQDGTINQAYYQNKAQSYYNNGLIPNAQQNSSGGVSQAGGQGQTGVASLPPNIANQPYVIPASGNAPAYINLGRVPTGQQQYVATTAGNAGIPVLSADDASNVQGIQYTQQALQPLETVMNQVLAPGVTGRGLNIAKNFINNIFQNQPELVAFNQARSTAIKVIQSLAAGQGSGFRLTQPEIDTATSNMPSATDNLETAQTKLQYVKSYLANELNLKITGNANNYVAPGSQSANNSSKVIQTKVGAVDNSWF